jgi:1-deoxy-D-xylulose-5-phosphate reductoisomerase
VAAFLEGRIPFLGIPRTIETVLQLTSGKHPASILDVLDTDLAARECAREVIARQLTGAEGSNKLEAK